MPIGPPLPTFKKGSFKEGDLVKLRQSLIYDYASSVPDGPFTLYKINQEDIMVFLSRDLSGVSVLLLTNTPPKVLHIREEVLELL